MKFDLLGKAVRNFRLSAVDYINAPITIIPVQQGDVQSRYFQVTLYDDRGDIDLSVYTTAKLNGTTPSGVVLTSECEISEDKKTVTVQFSGGLTARPGRVACDIRFTNEDGAVFTTQTFYVIVYESQIDTIETENDESYNELVLLIQEVKGLHDEIGGAESDRVEEYNQLKEEWGEAIKNINSAEDAAERAAYSAGSAQDQATIAYGHATSATAAKTAAEAAANAATQAKDEILETQDRFEKLRERVELHEKRIDDSLGKQAQQILCPHEACITGSGDEIFFDIDDGYAKVEEIRGKTVATENLIPYPYIDTDKTDHGIEWTELGDGRLKAVGTAEVQSKYTLWRRANGNIFVAGTTYTLQNCTVSYVKDNVTYWINTMNGTRTIVWNESWTFGEVYVEVSVNTTVNKIIAPMINIGSEALAYSSYFPGLKNAYFKSITSTGKNLIPYPYKFTSYVLEGVTITVNADGSVTLNGTATKSAGVNLLSVGIEKLPMGEYTISGGGKSVAVFSYKNGTAWIESNNANSAMTGSIKKGDKISGIGLYVTEGTHYSSVTVYPMFERGNTATAFESYTSDTLLVDSSIELPEYDVAYPERGEVKRQSNTVVLNGTETVGILTNAQGIIEFGVSLPKPSTADLGTINCVSNYFTPTTRTKIWHSEGGELIAATVGFLRIITSRCESNITAFKEFLASLYAAGNPVTVTYKTAEATTEAVEFSKSKYAILKDGVQYVDTGMADNPYNYGAYDTIVKNYTVDPIGQIFYNAEFNRQQQTEIDELKEEYVTKDTDQSISGKKTFKHIALIDENSLSQMDIDSHRISITDHDNSGSITLTPSIDSETGDYAPITDDYELYLPLKSGTLARVEDVAEVNEKLKREIDTLYKIEEQAGTYTVTEVEDTYISRETADGLNILDGAQTPVQEIRGKTVATKNLIPYPYIDTTKTDHGVGWTDLGDGRLKVVGETADAFSTYFLSRKNIFIAGNTYTLKDCVVSYKENDVEYYLSSQTGSKTFVWQESWTLVMIYVQILRNTVVDRIYMPMINIGSEALAYSPYFPGLKDTYFKSITSTGKNLIPYPYIDTDKTSNGVSWADLGDGRLKVIGLAGNMQSMYDLSVRNIFTPGTTYTVKNCVIRYDDNGVAKWFSSGDTKITFVWKESYEFGKIYAQVSKNTAVDKIIAPMINVGSEALDFEPYNSDTLSVETPIELSEYDVAYPERGEVKRQSNTVVLDGTERVSIAINEKGATEFLITGQKPIVNLSAMVNCVANHFTVTSINKMWHVENEELIAASADRIRILTSRCESNIASFREFLASLYAAGNPVTVTYKTAEVTTEAVEFNKSSYTAWKNGSETIEQGETDNSEYGAELTVSQKYYTLAGGTNDEN